MVQENQAIGLIGAPFDLCGLRVGSRLGPAALRLAGLPESLSRLGYCLQDYGDVCGNAGSIEGYTAPGGLANFTPLVQCVTAVKSAVKDCLDREEFPILLGGDHALAMGSVAAALSFYRKDLAVLWIDAHADVNTPGSSETGNVHGMPLAALAHLDSGVTGPPHEEWMQLKRALGEHPVRLDRVAWYGLRDVDAPEVPRLNGLALTMHDVDRYGVEATVKRLDNWLRSTGATKLWISFDVDAMDPLLAPGTGTAVRGGLTYREAHLLAELLHEALRSPSCPYQLVGLDVVEVNPLIDSGNQTAIIAVEWVASLFGKRILGSL